MSQTVWYWSCEGNYATFFGTQIMQSVFFVFLRVLYTACGCLWDNLKMDVRSALLFPMSLHLDVQIGKFMLPRAQKKKSRDKNKSRRNAKKKTRSRNENTRKTRKHTNRNHLTTCVLLNANLAFLSPVAWFAALRRLSLKAYFKTNKHGRKATRRSAAFFRGLRVLLCRSE